MHVSKACDRLGRYFSVTEWRLIWLYTCHKERSLLSSRAAIRFASIAMRMFVRSMALRHALNWQAMLAS
jgi:hypothetical protein